MDLVDEEVALLRRAWRPADFENGQFLGSNFSSSDLEPAKQDGKWRYSSVDQRERMSKSSVDAFIERQQEGDRRVEKGREEVCFVGYRCGDIRNLPDGEQRKPFEVAHEPEDENPGHCGIHNLIGPTLSNRKRRLYVDELRTMLTIDCQHTIHEYDDIFPVDD